MAGKLGDLPSGFSTQYAVYERRQVRLSTGRLVAFVPVTGGVAVQVSDNDGDTWQTCNVPTDGIISTNTKAVISASRDPNDGIHVLIGTYDYTLQAPLDFHLVTVSGLTATSVKTQAEAAAGTNYAWQNVQVKYQSNGSGTIKNILLAYDWVNTNVAPATNTLYVRSASVAGDGTLTLGTRYTLSSVSEGGSRHLFSISRARGGTCKMIYQQVTSPKLVRVNLSAPLTTPPSQTTIGAGYYYASSLAGIDGLNTCMWAEREGSNLHIREESDAPEAKWATFTGTAATRTNVRDMVGDHDNNRILGLGVDSSTSLLALININLTSKALTDMGVQGKQTVTGTLGYGLDDYNGKLTVLYTRTGDGIWSETINLGAATGYHMII